MRMRNPFRQVRLPKMSLIIGKKQLVIGGLVVVMGAAVVVNVAYASANRGDIEPTNSETENYGDTLLVSGATSTSGESTAYFARARLDRQNARDEAKEFLTAVYNGGDNTKDELAVIAQQSANLSDFIETEVKVESLLKAQGFEDALCYLSDSGANIIVKTSGLTAQDAAKIKSALLSEVAVDASNITIVEIN